ncbi:MAG: hypothetical protein DRG78_01100 [Epsilonproteobacteria bacterium]|nr:MAG: hypothetical protein DRG78_01100 [Campylobacterota bacterium]
MKKSIVLFTTLLLIMALLSVMMLFLNTTKEVKDNTSEEFALIQTNSVMSNLSVYFKNVAFDEETIFYGSKIPFTLPYDGGVVKFNIDSAHKYLNINLLAVSMKNKNNDVYEQFIAFLYQHRLRDPEFFVDLILDTFDKDSFEINSGSGSEIVLENPVFRNGKIHNKKHFKVILDYYFLKTNDKAIYDIPFNKIISFNAYPLDINFASKELLKIFFYDADQYTLDAIAEHKKIYEKMSDLGFDRGYEEILSKGRYGHSVNFKTIVISVNVELSYKNQFKSKVNFLYNTTTKKLAGYRIIDIEIIK